MDMTGEVRIPAERRTVWAALNDPDVLARCIPGCDKVERQGDDVFTAVVAAKIGPVSAKFSGKVTLNDVDPPNGYTLKGEGTGGVAGFGKGEARVVLTDDGAATLLSYAVKAQVGGKLAQIGSRLVDGAARKLSDEFFNRLAAALTTETDVETAGGAENGTGGAVA